MVTKSTLLKQRTQQQAEKAQQAKLNEQRYKQEVERFAQAERERIETMLDTDLGDLLQAANAAGLDTIRFGYRRAWELSETSSGDKPAWITHRGYDSPLQFDPEKGNWRTTRLVEILRQAGFHVSLDTQQVLDVHTSRVEYDLPQYGPGTHPVYYMRISWGD